LNRRTHDHRRFADKCAYIFDQLSIEELSSEVNNRRIYFLSKDNWAFRKFFRFGALYDSDQIRNLGGFIFKSSCFWDIGANYGVYTISLLDFFRAGNLIILIEPLPKVFQLLRKSTSFNNMNERSSVFLYNCAAGEDGQGNLYLSEIGSADSRVYQPKDNDIYNYGKSRKKVEINIRSLDRIAMDTFDDFPTDNVIKLDVQGFELEVVRSAKSLIENSKRIVIFIEFWPHGLQQNDTNPRELIFFFKDKRFRVLDNAGRNKSY